MFVPRECDAGATNTKASERKPWKKNRIKADLKQKNRFKEDKADLKCACMKLLWRKSGEDRIGPS